MRVQNQGLGTVSSEHHLPSASLSLWIYFEGGWGRSNQPGCGLSPLPRGPEADGAALCAHGSPTAADAVRLRCAALGKPRGAQVVPRFQVGASGAWGGD